MVVASWWGCGFLLRRLVQLPALLCCEAMVWAVSFLAFPLRLLAAVERERKMGGLVAEMQAQMDGLVWENRALEEKLRAAVREREALEAVLDEMEEEHDDAFARIDALEAQLKALRQENMRPNEHKGKAMWDKTPAAAGAARRGSDGKSVSSGSAKKAASPRDVAALQEVADASYLLGAAPSYSYQEEATEEEEEEAMVARQGKAVARRRSLFSLGMSLAVGAVAWTADAPCLPLLAGLFAVVGVSMRSVSRSCAALRRRGPAAAADAVALLSLNWFLLGVLTAPMLPGVARAVVPRAGRVLGPAIAWLAAAAPL